VRDVGASFDDTRDDIGNSDSSMNLYKVFLVKTSVSGIPKR
jgi:hypothetical protein